MGGEAAAASAADALRLCVPPTAGVDLDGNPITYRSALYTMPMLLACNALLNDATVNRRSAYKVRNLRAAASAGNLVADTARRRMGTDHLQCGEAHHARVFR